MDWYIYLILFIVLVFAITYYNQKVKRESLLKRYKDPVLVEKIMNGNYWIGQNKRQLIDSLGKPVEKSEQILKTKKKEIWKYDKMGQNRYRLKITLEDNKVVGWDKK